MGVHVVTYPRYNPNSDEPKEKKNERGIKIVVVVESMKIHFIYSLVVSWKKTIWCCFKEGLGYNKLPRTLHEFLNTRSSSEILHYFISSSQALL